LKNLKVDIEEFYTVKKERKGKKEKKKVKLI